MQREAALRRLQEQVEESLRVKKEFFAQNAAVILSVVEAMATTIQKGGKILVCGNGGSASDSLHFAGEMVGRFMKERRPLPMVALTSDVATLTAVGNDYGFDQIFARQVGALGQKGDLLFAISTSGKSPNVLKAVTVAQEKGMRVIGLTGQSGGELGKVSDLHLNVALGKNSARIQETHITAIHILVDLLDEFYLSS